MDAYAVRSGTQSRQDPHVWGAPLTRGEASVRLPSEQESGLSTNSWLGNLLSKISFSTVSLGTVHLMFDSFKGRGVLRLFVRNE
jgi:hypothetical protein